MIYCKIIENKSKITYFSLMNQFYKKTFIGEKVTKEIPDKVTVFSITNYPLIKVFFCKIIS
jgi:hypothetical protein